MGTQNVGYNAALTSHEEDRDASAVPQGVRSAIGSVGELAGLRRGVTQIAISYRGPRSSHRCRSFPICDRQLRDIARYIRYARQQRRYEELVTEKTDGGDAGAGRAYFDQQCAACHASDLAGIAQRCDASELRTRLLRPASLNTPLSFAMDAMKDSKVATGRQRHNLLLENLLPADVANLLAFLRVR